MVPVSCAKTVCQAAAAGCSWPALSGASLLHQLGLPIESAPAARNGEAKRPRNPPPPSAPDQNAHPTLATGSSISEYPLFTDRPRQLQLVNQNSPATYVAPGWR